MVRSIRVLSVTVVAVALLALTACGNGDDEPTEASSEETTTTAKSSNGTTATTAEPTVRTIGKTGWHEGFAITVDTAKLEAPSFSSAGLELAVTYENLTTETARVPQATNIVQDGLSINET